MRPHWASFSDQRLLDQRFQELGLRWEMSDFLRRGVARLDADLAEKGFVFRPRIYLGDEWFSPEGVPSIAIPFFLAHPRLMDLERQLTGEVEGESEEELMKLLRHETGHCVDHAYRLSRRRSWREHFGSPSIHYTPEVYRPRPDSRDFVLHLANSYAQAHPDEDFAETFAVWLDPESNWAVRYRSWPVALAKLRYVDGLMRELRSAPPVVSGGYEIASVNRMRTRLRLHYQRRGRGLPAKGVSVLS